MSDNADMRARASRTISVLRVEVFFFFGMERVPRDLVSRRDFATQRDVY